MKIPESANVPIQSGHAGYQVTDRLPAG